MYMRDYEEQVTQVADAAWGTQMRLAREGLRASLYLAVRDGRLTVVADGPVDSERIPGGTRDQVRSWIHQRAQRLPILRSTRAGQSAPRN